MRYLCLKHKFLISLTCEIIRCENVLKQSTREVTSSSKFLLIETLLNGRKCHLLQFSKDEFVQLNDESDMGAVRPKWKLKILDVF